VRWEISGFRGYDFQDIVYQKLKRSVQAVLHSITADIFFKHVVLASITCCTDDGGGGDGGGVVVVMVG